MMPYPANRARAEHAAGDLLETQAVATAAFEAVITTARTTIAALDFPLGSPAEHFDLADIDGALGDLLVRRSDSDLEAAAFEIADGEDAAEAATYADFRRGLAQDELWQGAAA
jgi:hypothetical protein